MFSSNTNSFFFFSHSCMGKCTQHEVTTSASFFPFVCLWGCEAELFFLSEQQQKVSFPSTFLSFFHGMEDNGKHSVSLIKNVVVSHKFLAWEEKSGNWKWVGPSTSVGQGPITILPSHTLLSLPLSPSWGANSGTTVVYLSLVKALHASYRSIFYAGDNIWVACCCFWKERASLSNISVGISHANVLQKFIRVGKRLSLSSLQKLWALSNVNHSIHSTDLCLSNETSFSSSFAPSKICSRGLSGAEFVGVQEEEGENTSCPFAQC